MRTRKIVLSLTFLLFCSGCSDTQQTSAPPVQVASIPTSRPTAKPTPSPTLTRSQKRKETRRLKRAEARARAAAAYDVPGLLQISIDKVRAKLGPVEDKGLDDEDDGGKSWSNSKGSVLVHYDVSTREVESIFLEDDLGEPFKDKGKILALGNLKENNPHYSLEFVGNAGSKTEWLGVTVTPN